LALRQKCDGIAPPEKKDGVRRISKEDRQQAPAFQKKITQQLSHAIFSKVHTKVEGAHLLWHGFFMPVRVHRRGA
jgi:hypothetical protein